MALPFPRILVNLAGIGISQLVAPVDGKTVNVVRFFFNFGGNQTIDLQDSNGATLIGRPFTFSAGGGWTLDYIFNPWFVLPSGLGVQLVTTTTATVAGIFDYTQM